MSVEIEVGLENAAKVKRPAVETEPPRAIVEKQPLITSKLRGRLVVGGIVLLAAFLGLFLYFHDRESTDDAQVDGHITPVASKIYGRISKVLVNDNEPVKAGELLARIDDRAMELFRDQAAGS